jgi:inorganic pyrophosphatase
LKRRGAVAQRESAKLGIECKRKPVGLTYPYDWGVIPSTEAEDGDPLDVLIIHDAATFPGLVLRCKPIGILELVQIQKGKKERNDRVFVIPDRSPFEGDLQDIRRLPARAIEELERFFEATDSLERKKLKFLGWRGPAKAIEMIKRHALSEHSFYRDGLQFISSRPLEADRQQFCLVRSPRLSVALTMVEGNGHSVRRDQVGQG